MPLLLVSAANPQYILGRDDVLAPGRKDRFMRAGCMLLGFAAAGITLRESA
jgi:hypothetical protein